MTPYGNLLYFIILMLLFLPIIICGLRGKKITFYSTLVGWTLILLIFKDDVKQLLFFICFTIFQSVLVINYRKYREKYNNPRVFYFLIALTLLPLILTKVQPFFISKSIIGFLGISYVTFKTIQLLIEIRDGLIKSLTVFEFLQFFLFFPTFTSGPIDRYRRFEKDFKNSFEAGEYKRFLFNGINLIFRGFLYKYIIAHAINLYIISNVYLHEDLFVLKLLYMYAYSFYLFFDFAGYSAFAVGVSFLLGVQTPQNFNKPFLSRNIKDFWNRWHMTLSFWFRDYVYMRLVFFLQKKKIIKNRYVISYISYFTLFFLMGLWHGLALHFIVYGIYHAILIICYDLFERKNKEKKLIPRTKFTDILSIIITFHFICFGFLIFSGTLF
ncbi:D-alanyl-lipoteichoic acid biosynthesis protein DltB [Gottfriedia sp. NPDC057948]|uniref:D-alanyl-lipoteichoic acid biosynthesis protein DltB n=1 Tax=Gottfriedia sp. NPDC057948 TaxID=3346287 RepID=UPI0036DF37DC